MLMLYFQITMPFVCSTKSKIGQYEYKCCKQMTSGHKCGEGSADLVVAGCHCFRHEILVDFTSDPLMAAYDIPVE